jgi:hypothetical protein
MKIIVKVSLGILVFIISYLAWPSFKYENTCGYSDSSDVSNGCPVLTVYDYSSYKLGGGLASLDTRQICYRPVAGDGERGCDVVKNEIERAADEEYAFPSNQALLGSLFITAMVSILLWLSEIVQFTKRIAHS